MIPRLIIFVLLAARLVIAVQDRVSPPLVAIFIDAKTESALGPFPYDRAVYAKAVDTLKSLKARAVILKYFLDLPRTIEGDDALAHLMKGFPVFLQARLAEEPKPNPLDPRFFLSLPDPRHVRALSGDSGWIPLRKFQDQCTDLGFVDIRDRKTPTRIPMIEQMSGKSVKSLYLAILEFMFGPSRLIPGKSLSLNKKFLKLNDFNEIDITLPSRNNLQYLSFCDLLDGTIPMEVVQGKIVVLGYDGPKAESFDTRIGKVQAHSLFYYSLLDLINRFK